MYGVGVDEELESEAERIIKYSPTDFKEIEETYKRKTEELG
jgi:hypothetical protein